MSKRTFYIVTAFLIAVILTTGGYILKTMLSESKADVKISQTAQTAEPSPTVQSASPEPTPPVTDTVPVGGSAASRQAAENNPMQPREVTRAGGAQQRAGGIIVLDPGHGKSSSLMSEAEKTEEGYVKNSSGVWGEWRHWKSGSSNVECYADGCSKRAPNGADCWYRLGNGDRDTEPQINLNNALAARNYLEQMGYTVRMTRTSNDQNPSFSKRVSYCYPNNDTSAEADAEVYVCIHSNAGGGKGSAYISAGGTYDQRMRNGANASYAENSNALGKAINSRITIETSLSQNGSGTIGGEEALIAFCKSPVPVGYIEIGFFDNSSDLSILRSESDRIGLAIAEGVDDYIKSH